MSKLQSLKSLSVGIKVMAVVGLCLVALAGVAALAITQMAKIGNQIEAVAQQDIPLTTIVTNITIHQLEQAINFERAIRYGVAMADDPHAAESFHHAVEEFEHLAAKVDEELKQGEELAADAAAHAHSRAEAEEFQHVLTTLSEIEVSHTEFDTRVLETFALLSSGSIHAAVELEEEIEVSVENLDHRLEALLIEIENFTQQAILSVEQREQTTMTILIAASIAASLVAFGLAWLIIQGVIARPLKEVVGALNALIAGDTSIAVKVRSQDEIGEVAKALDIFREKIIENQELAAKTAEQEQANERDRKEALLAMADDLEGSVGGIVQVVSSAATEMQSSARAMKTTAAETSDQATAVASASEVAANNVQTVASATEELSSSVAEISRQVSQSSELAQQAVEESGQMNTEVQGLEGAVQRIGDVVSLINDIAAQTNLLALNATIEAARAGDAGKGFAVVASEVKSLASQTANATEEIGTQIASVQTATSSAVDVIQRIAERIGQISEITGVIATAVGEQGSATNEIARNIQEASTGTQAVNTNITKVNSAASETGQSAEQMLSASGELSTQSETLRAEVEKFLAQVRAA